MKNVCRLVFHCVIPVLLTVSVPLSYISKNNKYNKIQIFCISASVLMIFIVFVRVFITISPLWVQQLLMLFVLFSCLVATASACAALSQVFVNEDLLLVFAAVTQSLRHTL